MAMNIHLYKESDKCFYSHQRNITDDQSLMSGYPFFEDIYNQKYTNENYILLKRPTKVWENEKMLVTIISQ